MPVSLQISQSLSTFSVARGLVNMLVTLEISHSLSKHPVVLSSGSGWSDEPGGWRSGTHSGFCASHGQRRAKEI